MRCTALLSLVGSAAALHAPSTRPVHQRAVVQLVEQAAPRAAAPNRKADVLDGMPLAEQERFFETLREQCEAKSIDASELSRFDAFCDSVRDSIDAPRWRAVPATGQSVQTRRYYPRLSAIPCWDDTPEHDIFPWLSALEARAADVAVEVADEPELRERVVVGEDV